MVDRLDGFISHDWRTSRVEKISALWVMYNARAAIISSVLVAVLSTSVELLVTSNVFWPSFNQREVDLAFASSASTNRWPFLYRILCPVSLVLVVVYWQVFRKCLLRRPDMLFLDKLCINQSDVEEKKAGIQGLAGFINQSSRLKILWSKQYFKRLWCTYELASWFYQDKHMQNIDFMPVSFAHALLLCTAWSCATWFIITSTPLLGLPWWWEVAIQICPVCLALGVVRSASAAVHDLCDLPQQISGFSIRDSRCFCCDTNHSDDAGQTIPCDRELVYEALKRWFGEEDVQDDSHLDDFDLMVRSAFGMSRNRGQNGNMPYRHAIFISCPALWTFVARFPYHLLFLDGQIAVQMCVEDLMWYICVWPSLIGCVFRIIICLPLHVDRRRWKVWCKNVCILAVACACFGVLYVPILLVNMVMKPWYLVIFVIVEFSLTMTLFHHDLPRGFAWVSADMVSWSVSQARNSVASRSSPRFLSHSEPKVIGLSEQEEEESSNTRDSIGSNEFVVRAL